MEKTLMWAERIGHELYIFWRGKLIYKRWVGKNGKKTQASVIFNEKWPNVEVITKTTLT
jgi:hypothetical protein